MTAFECFTGPRAAGLWPPHCAYRPELEADLAGAGVGYPFRDSLGFFFTDPPPPQIYTAQYTLSLHDALPISGHGRRGGPLPPRHADGRALLAPPGRGRA